LKEILRHENTFYLRVIQQFLSGHDIPAFIMDEHSGSLMSGIGNILPRLMVLDEDVARAKVLVAAEDFTT